MKRTKLAIVTAVILVCSGMAMAGWSSDKVAVVDFKEVFDRYPKCIEARKMLKESTDQIKAEMDAELAKETDDAKKSGIAAKYSELMKKCTVEILNPVVDDVKSTADAVAKAKGMGKLYDKREGVEGIDITQDVIKVLKGESLAVAEQEAEQQAAAKAEEARLAAEKARAEEEAKVAAAKAEEEARLAAEKARAEEARLAAEKAKAEEEARLAAEKAKAEEEARLIAEKAKAEEEARLAAEKALAERVKAEKAKAEAAAKLAAKQAAAKRAEKAKAAKAAATPVKVEVSSQPKSSIEVQFGADYDEPDITRMVKKALRNGINGAYVNAIIGKKGMLFCRARVPASSYAEAKEIARKLSAIGFRNYIVKM